MNFCGMTRKSTQNRGTGRKRAKKAAFLMPQRHCAVQAATSVNLLPQGPKAEPGRAVIADHPALAFLSKRGILAPCKQKTAFRSML